MSFPISTGLVFMPAWLPFAPPLGITAVAAYLQKESVSVRLFDFNGSLWSELPNYAHYWKMEYGGVWSHTDSYREKIHPFLVPKLVLAAQELADSGVQSLGFSVYSSNYLPTRFVIKLVRTLRPDIKIYIGGASVDKKLAEQDLRAGLVDAAVFSEGEDSCLRLLKYWNGELALNELKGIMLFDPEGKLLDTPRNTLVKLAQLPAPDFSFYNFNNYYGRTLPLEFGRGCVADCSFCSETNYWVSYRIKTIDQIIAEIKNNVLKFNIREFRVVDSLMNGNFKFLEQLVDRLIAEDLGIIWYGFCRIDKKMTPELLAKMRKAGCVSISYGLESGSQKVLNLMNKKVNIADSFKVVRDTASADIKVCAEILMGFPGETIIDVAKTFYMIFTLRHQLHTITTGTSLEIVENSELKRNPEKYGVIYRSSENWWTKTYLNNPFTRKYLLKITNFWVNWVGVKLGYPQIR